MTPILLTRHDKTTVVLDAERIARVNACKLQSKAKRLKGATVLIALPDVSTEEHVTETPLQIYAKLTEALGPADSADDEEDDEGLDVIECPACGESDGLSLLDEDEVSRTFLCGVCAEEWIEEHMDPEEDE